MVTPDKAPVGAVPGVRAITLPENAHAPVTCMGQVRETPCFAAASPPAAAHSTEGPRGGRAVAAACWLVGRHALGGPGTPGRPCSGAATAASVKNNTSNLNLDIDDYALKMSRSEYEVLETSDRFVETAQEPKPSYLRALVKPLCKEIGLFSFCSFPVLSLVPSCDFLSQTAA